MSVIISEIKRNNLDLKTAEIEGLLYLLLNQKDLTNSGLLRITGLPKETLKHFLNSIATGLQKQSSDFIYLNESFAQELSVLNLKPFKWTLLEVTNYDAIKKLKDIRKSYKIDPKREFDQFFATEESSIKKAEVLDLKGQITGKNIVILGDDDLVSISIALINPNYASITVLEIDDELISLLSKVSKDLGLKNITYKKLDFRDKLKAENTGKYDVAVMDPPYTANGVKVFLNNGIKLLKTASHFDSPYLFLYYGNSFKSPEKTLKIQEIINKFGFIVEDKIDKLISYNGAESIGSSSSLYILKKSKFTQFIENLDSTIYTYEDNKESKFPYVDHLVYKVLDVSDKVINSEKELNLLFVKLCNMHRLKIVDTKIVRFKGKGHTLNYTLSNSTLAVHTWPEYNAIHIIIASCSPIYQKEAISTNISKLFGSKKVEELQVE